jgi:hypothetical protein
LDVEVKEERLQDEEQKDKMLELDEKNDQR